MMICGDAQNVARKQNATQHTNRRYFCDHVWSHYGRLDDLKKRVKCGKVAEKTGDLYSMAM